MSLSPEQYYRATLSTPLGDMVAIADDKALHFLEFTDRAHFDRQLNRVVHTDVSLQDKNTPLLNGLQGDLDAYFAGACHHFETPLRIYGSSFQRAAMQALCAVPYGQTHSYAQQAKTLGKPSAVRAVARANSMNQIALLIPCHRIIGSDGRLSGYAGGIKRKKWLLDHEKKYTI